MSDLNVFDAFGLIRADLNEAEINSVPKNEQPILFALLEAHLEVKAADEAAITGEADRRKASTALDRAKAAYELAKPRWDAYDEWRKTVAKLPQAAPDPAVVKKAATALKAVTAAEEHLAACVAAIAPVVTARHAARTVYVQRLQAWNMVDTRPKNVADLVRARSETERRIAMANIANGMPPDYAAENMSTVGPSHLDRSRGALRGGSANFGHNLNRMRGADIANIAKAQALKG